MLAYILLFFDIRSSYVGPCNIFFELQPTAELKPGLGFLKAQALKIQAHPETYHKPKPGPHTTTLTYQLSTHLIHRFTLANAQSLSLVVRFSNRPTRSHYRFNRLSDRAQKILGFYISFFCPRSMTILLY